ncbi:DUF805 domain-containing protein [Plantibacter auratus]|uniref:DUF805 domain-containing protein n=1 Tax=Plantibacter auratus TaxID=272914 RepID=UPI003D334CBC
MSSADEHAVTANAAEADRKDDRRIPARFADDSPLPGAGPIQAFLRFWKRYPIFTGRASRSEFWWWVVVHAVIVTALLVIGRGVDVATGVTAGFWEGQVTEGPAWGVQSILSGIWGLATIIPGLSLNARRMHDTDHSGWWQLINLVPIFGWFFFIWLAAQPSDRGGARYDTGPHREGAQIKPGDAPQ